MSRKNPLIRYTSRDFRSIKEQLIDYVKRYYPNTHKDFNEASFGSMVLDIVSYVGDILSYYADFQANESFLDSAIEYNNILRHAKSLGYKFTNNPSSFGDGTFYIIVPAKVQGLGPDSNYIPMLLKGSEFSSISGNSFILNENVDFTKSTNEIIVAQVDGSTGIPISYAIKAVGQLISGELFKQNIIIGDFTKFLRVPLDGENIAEVISVIDSEGHEYFEVDFLSQNVIYKAIPNFNSDRSTANSILKPIVVPRRFIVEQELTTTFLQFGYGTTEEIRVSSVVDPSTVILQLHGKDYYTDNTFDPTNLISTDKFGVVPSNTILTVMSRNNSTSNVNAAVASVTVVNDPIFQFDNITTLNQSTVGEIINSLEISNEEPIIGDITLPTSEEIKRRVFDVFVSQNRAVTKQDYLSIIYQMPSKFGKVKRANIVQDNDSFKRNLNLYVLAENQDGTLTIANNTLKTNLKTWLESKKNINDTIDILDGRIFNIGINFTAIVDTEKNKFVALSQALSVLSEFYRTSKDIGESFLITDVYSLLKTVPVIVDVISAEIVSLYGGSYSDNALDIDSNMSADGRMLLCPSDGVFEVKFPTNDIKAVIK